MTVTLSHSGAPAQPNKSVQGSMECLLYLVSRDHPVGIREMARDIGMDPTRVNRLLGTLAQLGFVERTTDRKYRPGSGVHVFSAMAMQNSPLMKAALPHISLLQEKTGLRVALGVLWRTEVCYLYHGHPGQPIHQGIAGHELYPAEHSSIGLTLLSHWTNQEALDLYDHSSREPLTDEARERLIDNLSQTRERGYGVEATRGGSIAVPIGAKPVAGLAIAHLTPHHPLSDAMIQEALEPLRSTARLIAESLENR